MEKARGDMRMQAVIGVTGTVTAVVDETMREIVTVIITVIATGKEEGHVADLAQGHGRGHP